DRHDRGPFLATGLHQREEEHQEREQALGGHVMVVDGEPVATIAHGRKRVIRMRYRAADLDQGPERPFRTCPVLLRWPDPTLLHVRLRHSDEGRQIDEDLEDRPAQDGEFPVVRGYGPVHHPDILSSGVQAEALPYGEYRFGDGRVYILAEGHEDGLVAFGTLHAQAGAASGVEPAEVAQQGVEPGVGWARAQVTAVAVADTVYLVHGEAQHRVDGIPGLDEAQDGRRRYRRHQRAREALTHQRRVSHGRTVGIAALGPEADAVVRDAGDDAGGTEDRPGGCQRALQRVPTDDLPNVQEHRGIAIA